MIDTRHLKKLFRDATATRARAVLTALVVVAAIGSSVYAVAVVRDVPQKNTFILREDGWHPRKLLIQPGEKVTFVNHSKNAFWPATNNHPQHDQYSGFDVGHPVPVGESWSFVFDKPGQWGFHDHLRSFYTGYVDVGDAAVTYDCSEHLAGAKLGNKESCWQNKLQDELVDHGAQAAFQLLLKFYNSDPDFTVVGCHIMVHQIGDAAYGEYLAQGKDLSKVQFPAESVYCGYGYYHGFLEHFLRDNPDFALADKFCKQLTAAKQNVIPRIRLNCYHAIGHGFIPNPNNIETWGDAHAMVAPGIAACSKLTDREVQQECFQGSFNVVGDWMWNNEYGLEFPKKNSLGICATFTNPDPHVAEACYYELSMRVLPFAGHNLTTVYDQYVAPITDNFIAGMIINSAAASLLGEHIADKTFLPFLYECRALPERVHSDCIKGLTGAFVAHGEPEKEYVKAIAFCSSKEMTSAEKDTCYGNIIRTFKGAYTKGKVAEVCTLVEEPYRKYCVYN